ncbi:MAG: inositol monophosphatase [Deltaproteobacteria bacterium]|nr:inositol monophosphatase [Deltaproteobacteria bacterium]
MRPSLDVSYKPDGSVVTNADMAVQELVVRRLRDAFPDAAIVAEENGLVENADAVFAVDPIDGTDSYQRGFPHFGISIGLVENGRCVLGVFFGPVLGELYAVDAGETPTLNGEPIRSRDRSGGTAPLLTPSHFHKMFVTDFPGKVRSYGSMAYHLAYVASGQARGAMAFDSHIWDLAAGVALLEAAGARLRRAQRRAV